MKALTIHQPWASLIIEKAKPFEFRSWRCWDSIIGKRIVIHAAAKKMARVDLLWIKQAIDERGEDLEHLQLNPFLAAPVIDKALDLTPRSDTPVELRSAIRGHGDLPWSAGLGTAIIGEPVKGTMDKWGWPLHDVQKWNTPVPAKGAQGFWNWKEAE